MKKVMKAKSEKKGKSKLASLRGTVSNKKTMKPVKNMVQEHPQTGISVSARANRGSASARASIEDARSTGLAKKGETWATAAERNGCSIGALYGRVVRAADA